MKVSATMSPTVAAELRDLARRLQSLRPDYANPQRFYQRRDDLADAIDRLTR